LLHFRQLVKLNDVVAIELTMNGSGASYASETVWNQNGVSNMSSTSGSGGGISSSGGGDYAIPYWQQGLSMTANHGSITQRNVPDVGGVASGVDVYIDGTNAGGVGTSVSAPSWAGFMALVNQQAASLGNPSGGFINPAIYAIGKGTGNTPYASAFHDVTTGNNEIDDTNTTGYPAPAGYDLCTGWGTPSIGLINALAGAAAAPCHLVVLNANDSGAGSLRQAISSAISGAYITFATNLSGATILSSGTVTLNKSLAIDASALPGGITINGNQAGTVFLVTNGNVVLTALTIINGYDTVSAGGGILNLGVLTVNQCTLAGNSGGGIFNIYGILVVNESTLTGNSLAGIITEGNGVTVNQSTLTGNSGDGIYYSDGGGGPGAVTIYNSIVDLDQLQRHVVHRAGQHQSGAAVEPVVESRHHCGITPRLRPISLHRHAGDQLQLAILHRCFAVKSGSVLSVNGKSDVAGQADTLLLCQP
jgi:hypothetical protein